MKVTGYKLREAVRRWVTAQSVAAKMFPETLFAFEGDQKDDPKDVDESFWTASKNIAELQELQQKYNMENFVEVRGERMTLSRAIKLVAFAGQRSKSWKTAASETGRGRFSDRVLTRSKEDEIASRKVSVKECLNCQIGVDSYLADLRTAIAVANGREIDMEIRDELV